MTQRGDFGLQGEDAAAEHLRAKGYKIRDRRYAVHNCGELDLVAYDGDCLVFVEVKARSTVAFGGALAAVTSGKQKKLVNAALYYIKEKALRPDSIRFDVVAIGPDGLEHLENAFSPSSNFTY